MTGVAEIWCMVRAYDPSLGEQIRSVVIGGGE